MREDFVSYVWKFQYFNQNKLATTSSERLTILNVGIENKNSGPDFFNARVMIGGQKWAGTVELHVNSSDWYVHGHENDTNYDNVILHVVWENDVPVYRYDNTLLPTLELQHIVKGCLVKKYEALFRRRLKWINCEDRIAYIDSFTRESWLERLYIERLERKASVVLALATKSQNDWEAILYTLLLKNFGLKVNEEAFLMLSQRLGFSIIRKERESLTRLEALLFGTAGLLDATIEEPYFGRLKKEYRHLAIKHKLSKSTIPVAFFRLRPANFPTIRLAQFASLYHTHHQLFSELMKTTDLNEIYDLLSVSASEFWTHHYTFEAASRKFTKKLTKSFMNLLLINSIIPLKFTYQQYTGKPDNEVILKMIRSMKSESNQVIQKFSDLKIPSDSAFSSQALLQLKHEYCDKQKCLQCRIGNSILSH